MYYAPHKLMKKVILPPEKDGYGRTIKGTGGETWEYVGNCRCDDVGAEEAVSINGIVYQFRYKVVYDKSAGDIEPGTEILCLREDGSIRGSGIAKRPLETNFLNYRVIWLE